MSLLKNIHLVYAKIQRKTGKRTSWCRCWSSTASLLADMSEMQCGKVFLIHMARRLVIVRGLLQERVGDLSQWGRHGRKNSNKPHKPGIGLRGGKALPGFVHTWCFCLLWVCWQVWREKIPAWQVSHQCGWWLIALFKLQLCQSQNPWILILDLLLEKASADETGPFYWCLRRGISAAATGYYWKERVMWLLALLCVCLASSFPVFLFPSSESSLCLHWIFHTDSERWQADTQSELITASNMSYLVWWMAFHHSCCFLNPLETSEGNRDCFFAAPALSLHLKWV